MASSAVHISNMKDAIASGIVPGAFQDDNTTFAFPTLAYTSARGATHLWTIRVRLIRGLEGDPGEYVQITDAQLDQPAVALPHHKAEIIVEAKQVGGKTREIVPTYVSAGKNVGKKNATNAISQAIRNALGLYNKQRKRGDIVLVPDDGKAADRDEADEADEADDDLKSDFDPMPPPMLVKKIGDSRDSTFTPEVFAAGVTAQRKFNGVHLVSFVRSGRLAPQLVQYSRTGTEYPGQAQLIAELLPMIVAAPKIVPGAYGVPASADEPGDKAILAAYGALPGGADTTPAPYFAGELYLHGKTLNWINGQARRGDDDAVLKFHIFDVFFPYAKAAGHDMESRHRQAYIDEFFALADANALPHEHVVRIENFPVATLEDLNALAKRFIADGYEGAIARKDNAGYRYSYSNYHSANLVKIKPVFDEEYPVVGFTQGTRGKDVGAVIWECEVPNALDAKDNRFTVVPKDMTYADRYAVYKCISELVPDAAGNQITRFERDIKGLPLTVEFREISSKTGKPLQAKALAFRTYEGGPDMDPIKRVLDECLPQKNL